MRRLMCCLFTLCLFGIVNAQKAVTLRIDPDNAVGGTVSQIFDAVRYVPLETTKDCLLGDVQNLRVSTHYFVFADYSTKSLYVFDKKGKFHAKINRVPMDGWNADNDFWRIVGSFVIDPKSENIYITYNDHDKDLKKYVSVFSPDGKLMWTKLMPKKMQDLSAQFVFLDNGNQLFSYTFPREQKDTLFSRFYFYEVHDFDSIVRGIVPTRPSDPMLKRDWDCWYHYDNNDGNTSLWNRSGDYSVFHFDGAAQRSEYRFVLPMSLSMDSLYYKDSSAMLTWEKTMDFYRLYKDKINNLGDLALTDNFLSFTLMKSSFYSIFDAYIYSLRTGIPYCLGRIVPDSMSYFLPISFGERVLSQGNLYCSIPSFILFQEKGNMEKKLWQKDSVLNNYFTTQNRKSNPVIVELKLKENL